MKLNDKHKQIMKYVNNLFPKKIYLVGGYLRDSLLNKEPHDLDLASAMTVEEVKQHLKGIHKTYGAGEKHGTVTFKVEGEEIELTTFRTDTYDGKSRKPKVEYGTSLKEDLERRDFTFNAMAYSVEDGSLTDLFNGQEDLENKVLRCVGNPTIRFKEDPLRLLRGARFISKLDVTPDEALIKSAKKTAHRILNVSKERWTQELDKLLMTDNPKKGLTFLQETGIMKYIEPLLAQQYEYDQNSKYHNLDLWTHTCVGLDYLVKQGVDLDTRYAFLYHDVGKIPSKIRKWSKDEGIERFGFHKHDLIGSEMIKTMIATRLKWSNKRRDFVSDLVLNHLREDSPLKEADMNSKGF